MSKLGGFELLAQEQADLAYREVMCLRDMPFGDTPIENLFFAALVAVAGREHRSVKVIFKMNPTKDLDYNWDLATTFDPAHAVAIVERQVQIAGWRVDFVIHYEGHADGVGAKRMRLLVECDGHDYHERTKAQAARDRSRDRLAQLEGLPIFRFTGSELWNDPAGCADEVLAFMERAA
jgi:very-short-patch-repair endonuclease